MDTAARRQGYFKDPFVLRQEDLTKLASVLQKYGPFIQVTVTLEDGISRTYKSIDQLDGLENTANNPIRKIIIASHNKDFSFGFDASWEGDADASWSVSISISGSEDEVVTVNDAFRDRLMATRPWYHVLAKGDTFIIGLVGLFVAASAAIAVVITLSIVRNQPFDTKVHIPPVIALLLALFWPIVWVVNRLRRFLFPKTVFAIGQGIERHKFMENIRWTVVVGFVVSVASGALFAIR